MTPPMLFLFGAQRSGTTYLQNLLGAHPAIATSQETRLFSAYLGPWLQKWKGQMPSDEELRGDAYRFAGLPAVLTEEQFREIVMSVVDTVYGAVLGAKPSASMVLDKVPEYARYGDEILEFFPDATFIHIIRDGRDVACSMLRASRGWGHRWAPRTTGAAAAAWKRAVEDARRMGERTDRYVELRYEDLIGPDGPAVFARVLDACGQGLPPEEVRSIYDAQRLQDGKAASHLVWSGEVRRRLGRDPEEPKGFFGKGQAGTWQEEMSTYDRWVFDRTAGDLLVELGYATQGWASDSRLDVVGPVRLWAEHNALGTLRVARAARSRLSA